MTIRYRLDDLGWYQFEQLSQSILKAQFGFAIQSWGGRGDWGRDAYFKGKLNYPSKEIQNEGTFVFQVKFVENANASGAKPKAVLLKAVKAEIDSILKRVETGRSGDINFYIILTNSVLSPELRATIESLFKEKFSSTEVYCHDGNDISDWLDNNQQIRRAFPQILSLRDLNYLLEEIINRHIYTQSKIAIEQAKEIAPVFVPTGPYQKTWETLKNHNFVVLEGPPEVGKTAIALMVVLTRLTEGWELIACKEPKEFIGLYKPDLKQVFMVDDAFGRTEYDPARGKLWEKDLPHVLRLINRKHWLILTSRKHIFERAYKDMDLEDAARNFPKPAEVIVDATKLTVEEKALMLYRQAKAEKLVVLSKEIIKKYAEFIVHSPNFTPERIRSFVKERLPDLSSNLAKDIIDSEILQKEISAAINNPTDRMKKTYSKLPESHKWLLALLVSIGEDKAVYLPNLEKSYNHYCPSTDGWPLFHDVIDELIEAFLKKTTIVKTEYVTWIHPSYRDLVIDEISDSIAISNRLLEFATLDVIKLAISDAGGLSGNRKLPLLTNNDQWELFRNRCIQMVDEINEQYLLASLLTTLKSSFSNSTDLLIKTKIAAISGGILEKLRVKWNLSKEIINHDLLYAYYEAAVDVTPLLPSPDLSSSWDASLSTFENGLRIWKENNNLGLTAVSEWIELFGVLNDNEPRFLRQIGFPEEFSKTIETFIELAGEELEADIVSSNAEELNGYADEIAEVAGLSKKMGGILSEKFPKLDELAEDLENKADSLKEEALELDPMEPDYDYEGGSSVSSIGDQFDVNRLFDDL